MIESSTSQIEEVKIIDNLTTAEDIDLEKLKILKAKLAKKDEMPPRIIAKKTRSIKISIVGSGQAGSRLAETFYKLGYDAIAINTAAVDLEHIEIPDDNKLVLQFGLGGSAKDTSIGHEAALMHKDKINEMVNLKLADAQVLLFCTSLGGGSGSGSTDVMLDILVNTGKPVLVMCVLPMSSEDSTTKRNALETLSKLSKELQSKRIQSIFCIDNSKIETVYSDVNQMSFFDIANKAIVEPIDAFNTFSARGSKSSSKVLDSMEFAKILTDGNGFCIFGKLDVPNYTDSTAVAEAVVDNLNSQLLASGFNLKETKYCGLLFIGNKKVWDQIPSSSVGYALSMVDDVCGIPDAKFHGIYIDDEMKDDVLRVYSIFSGLGICSARIDQLKKETAELEIKSKDKAVERNFSLNLDTGKEATINAADKIRQDIAKKKSAFSGLLNKSVEDLRKK